MNHFEYASKKQRRENYEQVSKLIKLVQKDLRKELTFQVRPTGSLSLNLVTFDSRTNTGYDFDFNIIPNDDDQTYSPKEIKQKLIGSFNKFCRQYGFDYCEDSTRVFTIKMKDRTHSKVIFSCDFAIVYDYYDNNENRHQRLIYFNKNQNTYEWQEQPQPFYNFYKKVKVIKDNGYWQDFRKAYLLKKNTNVNAEKSSTSLRRETANEVYQRFFD